MQDQYAINLKGLFNNKQLLVFQNGKLGKKINLKYYITQ